MLYSSLMLNHITFTFPQSPEPLFTDVTVSLPRGWTAVIGDNGIGKSTLMRIACGFLQPDAGSVTPDPASLAVRYCAQEVTGTPRNIEDFAADWSPEARKLRRMLGIDDSWLYRFTSLSGGEAKRVQIACAMNGASDVLVMDEPTNHVDGPTRHAIVEAMRDYRGIGVVISHDVALMDATCERCVVFDKRHIAGHNVTTVETVPGDVTAASELIARRDRSDRQLLRRAGKEVGRLKAVQAQRFHQVQRVETSKRRSRRINPKDHDARGRLHLAKATSLDSGVTSSYTQLRGRIAAAQHDVASLSTASKRYDGNIWIDAAASSRRELARLPASHLARAFEQRGLNHVGVEVLSTHDTTQTTPDLRAATPFNARDLSIGPKDHIAVCGPNGIGKTTLIELICSRLPYDVPRLVIAQRTTDHDATNAMRRLTSLGKKRRSLVLNAMAQLNADPDKLVADSSPSPGELRKLLLCLGLLDHPEMIVMDEPTNHLDLHSKRALAHALAAYPGALVVASHDEWFLEQTAVLRWQLSRYPTALP